ncbi:hypothetical protein BDR03DRAFT_970288, partial [Suillus americanus]
DLRGNDATQDRQRSSNPRFPMPSSGIPPVSRYRHQNDHHRDLHRSHEPFPRPFEPLGLLNAPRSVSPK